jgi:hypothetical protein
VGWLLCQGQAVSRSTYASLFAILGTAYGSGDGSTTFNMPNLQRRFPCGSQTGVIPLGSTGGNSDMPGVLLTASGYGGGEWGINDGQVGSQNLDGSWNEGPGWVVDSTPIANVPYQAVNYLIKY